MLLMGIELTELEPLVRRALAEDVGSGDLTTQATVPAGARARARITQKQPGVLYGLDAAQLAFALLDPGARFLALAEEGVWRSGGPVLDIEGEAAALLAAERTALNFLQRLSGVATLTARYVEAVRGTRARVLDTRKTTPGLRMLEKAAVAAGGGTNHRIGLFDAVLIKENHAALAGGVGEAVRKARACAPQGTLVEVECRDEAEVDEALAAGAERILLDNMSPARMRAIAGRVDGRAELEASGDDPGRRRDRGRLHIGRCPHALGPRPRPLSSPGARAVNLPMAPLDTPPDLAPEDVPALQDEVRALARERDAVILAHNYQRPEVQDVADYVGDSLGLSRQGAATDATTIAFCGVHFMAETASILSPEKTVLIPDLDAGCSLADSITPDQLRAWQAQHPGAVTVMYVNTTAEIKALTDYCVTSSNAVAVVEHILREHGPDTEILFGPDMFLGAYVEKTIGRALHVWDGECHVHAGIRPSDIARTRAEHPGADFLIHPECGCSTAVMEYVAAGDVDADGVHMLSTGGMLTYAAERAGRGGTAIMATETGMLHPLRMAAPDVDFIAANERASCRYMKMITLTKLRDGLRDGVFEVRVPEAIAERARVPIERMVAIG
jgi:quinolinate synthase